MSMALAAFRAFGRNTRIYAEHWLRTGERHPAEHHVITERLDPWCAEVEAGGLRDAMLAEVASAEKTKIASPEPQNPWSFSEAKPLDPPLSPKDTARPIFGVVVGQKASVSAKSDFPAEWEVLTDQNEIRRRRRGYPSVFMAEWWGETPKPPPYPPYPTGRISGITLAEYRRKLLPSIEARSAPVLLPARVALAALQIDKAIPEHFSPRRPPKWWPRMLPVARQDGEWLVERDELREMLFPEAYLGPRTACPVVVPRCRHCGRLSHFGWADLICDRCEPLRGRIETGAMLRYSLSERRGWVGSPTITDDELLLAFTHRFRDGDQRRLALDESVERKAKRAKRVAA
jgi:hypothetical protein